MSLAASATDSEQKRILEEMAEGWLKLADHAEKWFAALERTRDKIRHR
jgi:hypothetical protein